MKEFLARLDPVRWGLTLLIPLVGILLHEFSFGLPLIRGSYDTLFNLRRTIPVTEAVVVYLDEEAHKQLGQPLNAPWDRSLHARLVRRMTAAGARAVVFDIVMVDTGRTNDPADMDLARALRENGRGILAANARYPELTNAEPEMDLPFDAARDAVEDRWGHAQMNADSDQAIREHPPSYPPFKFSLGWVTASLLKVPITQAETEKQIETNALALRWINYYGPAYWLPHVSFHEALDPALTPDSMFRDKVVFVGASTITKFSGERKDAYTSPFALWTQNARERFIPGVEVQATVALNLLRGDWMWRTSHRTEWILILLVGGGGAALLLRWTPLQATLGAGVLLALITGMAWWMFTYQGGWFPWLLLLLLVALAWLASIGANSVRLYVQNRLYEQSLALYLSPKLVQKMAADKTRKFLQPGAETQELTIFFSDIAGFTSLSEGLNPDELAKVMNAYFETAVGSCIHKTDGTVVKYIGDAIFSFWNAPELQSDHAIRACEAALLFRGEKAGMIRGMPLVTRIGLHTGTANVGNFGSKTRVDYTALGENINLASRMEGLNKHLGTMTLLTGETRARLDGRYHTRRLGRYVLKGFEKAVEVHELCGRIEERPQWKTRDEEFALALAALEGRRFTEARHRFEDVIKRSGDDGPSRFLLEALAEMESGNLPEDWNGEVTLHEK